MLEGGIGRVNSYLIYLLKTTKFRLTDKVLSKSDVYYRSLISVGRSIQKKESISFTAMKQREKVIPFTM